MKWTVNYFEFYKKRWTNWAEEKMDVDGSLLNEGLRSYAYKQAETWAKLKSRALDAFESSIGYEL
jgi:hypothetical protein